MQIFPANTQFYTDQYMLDTPTVDRIIDKTTSPIRLLPPPDRPNEPIHSHYGFVPLHPAPSPQDVWLYLVHNSSQDLIHQNTVHSHYGFVPLEIGEQQNDNSVTIRDDWSDNARRRFEAHKCLTPPSPQTGAAGKGTKCTTPPSHGTSPVCHTPQTPSKNRMSHKIKKRPDLDELFACFGGSSDQCKSQG